MGRGEYTMTTMISVTEWNSGQTFQSKKLASEYFKIPITLVTKSLKNKEEVETKRGKKLRFSHGYLRKGESSVHKAKTSDGKTFNFGRYKGKELRDIPTDYLKWVYQNVSRCPKFVRVELDKRESCG